MVSSALAGMCGICCGASALYRACKDRGEYLHKYPKFIDVEEVALNVNTPRELKIAERLFAERFYGGLNHLKRC